MGTKLISYSFKKLKRLNRKDKHPADRGASADRGLLNPSLQPSTLSTRKSKDDFPIHLTFLFLFLFLISSKSNPNSTSLPFSFRFPQLFPIRLKHQSPPSIGFWVSSLTRLIINFYLWKTGAYDDEEAAAHAYDLAALKYWGHETILNFPLSTYQEELQEMEGQSKEEYIGSLRRKSSGFSRGVSKYRGVARHHHNGRWEARIGRVFGNKYLYLGTYATQEEAATAYDMAAIEYRGLNAVTNFDLSRYIKWLRPNQPTLTNPNNLQPNPDAIPLQNPNQELGFSFLQPESSSSAETTVPPSRPASGASTASSALGLLLQSSKFKEMLERTSTADCPSTPTESDPPRRSFPDDIQTYFACHDGDGNDIIFGELNSFDSPMFRCELDA